MSQLEILVCGAGIAGSTLAFWLAKADCKVTIIERSPEIRNSGLGIDIRGPAVRVIQRMGLEEKVRSRTTGEEGLSFVDTRDHTFAHFGIDKDNLASSPTSEIEIMRSDLAQLITEAALNDEHVQVEYATTVESVTQDENKVSVTFSSGKTMIYDLVIAADGLGSSTRKLLLADVVKGINPVQSIGQYTAYYSIPREERDGMLWKWYNAPGRRALMTRPKNDKMSCAYLSIMPKNETHLRELMKKSIPEQKAGYSKLFEGSGWQEQRLLSTMKDAPDFYLQHIAQVKLPVWYSGRCAVVGDAASCPSPLSGVGTSLAILGAYVLAGEIANSKHDHVAALKAYDQRLRPYVEKKQKLPPGVPKIANPETAVGVWILTWVIWFVGWSGVTKWFGGGGGEAEAESKRYDDDGFPLPDYKFT